MSSNSPTSNGASGTATVAGPTDATPAPAPKALPAVGGAAILARLRAQREAKAAAAKKSRGLTVLYASQLGTATEVAKTIHAEAESRGIKSKVASMNEFTFEQVNGESTPVVILVASSTGDGDCPDNAAKFYATMKRRTNAVDMLKGVQFTCLGLGDSNYTRYMHVPRTLRTRFQELGASLFYEFAEADEVDGIESVIDTWLEGLWPALQKATASASTISEASNSAPATNGSAATASPAAGFLPSGAPPLPACRVSLIWHNAETQTSADQQQRRAYRDPEGRYVPDAPFYAPIKQAKYLTSESSKAEGRRVIHLELDITGSGMKYQPGDSIGVMPDNPSDVVDALLERLGADPEAVFSVHPKQSGSAENGTADSSTSNQGGGKLLPHLNWPCTLRTALTKGCDLTSAPRKSLLRLLAEHCGDESEKKHLLFLCSRDGREAYTKEILEGKSSIGDLLAANSSCKPPLDALLEALPAMPARMYSIACSPLCHQDRVHVAFTVVQYETASGKMRGGIATTWLERLAQPFMPTGDGNSGSSSVREEILVPVFLRSGGAFKTPEELSSPWILIGPGTGVAPFRGFLQHRQAQLSSLASESEKKGGMCWLFFGCRKPDQDYLYESDFNNFKESGVLTQLSVAFSRAQADKHYVQHIMKAKSAELRDLIVEKKGYVFVCGDGARMASDVHATLLDILRGKCDDAQGDEKMKEAEAVEELGKMAKEGRYVRDIWS